MYLVWFIVQMVCQIKKWQAKQSLFHLAIVVFIMPHRLVYECFSPFLFVGVASFVTIQPCVVRTLRNVSRESYLPLNLLYTTDIFILPID